MTEQDARHIINLETKKISESLNRLRAAKAVFPQLKSGHYAGSAGSILNAYREGDLTFDEAVTELQTIRINTVRDMASAGF